MVVTKVHEYFRTKDEKVMQSKLLALMESKGWDVGRSAKQLGVSPYTLWRIIRDRPNIARARAKARARMVLSKLG